MITVLVAFSTHWIGAAGPREEGEIYGSSIFFDFAWTSVIGVSPLSIVAMEWLLVRLRRR